MSLSNSHVWQTGCWLSGKPGGVFKNNKKCLMRVRPALVWGEQVPAGCCVTDEASQIAANIPIESVARGSNKRVIH